MTCTGCGVFTAQPGGGLCKVCEVTPPERRPNAALALEAEKWTAEERAVRRPRRHRPAGEKERAA